MAPASRISRIRWCSRKSRTKRGPNHRTIAKSYVGNICNKVELLRVSNSMDTKSKVLLQYCRRKFRPKSTNSCHEEMPSEMVVVTEALMSTSHDLNLRTSLEECVDSENHSNKENKAIDIRGEKEIFASDLINVELGGDVKIRCNVSDFASFKVPENLANSDACKPYSFSTYTELVDDVLSTECLNNSLQVGERAASMSSEQEDKGKKLDTAKITFGSGGVQTRKIEQQSDALNTFVRSPCEGLRPRKSKEGPIYLQESEMAEEKSLTKKLKKSSGNSVSCSQVIDNVTSYQCNIEGCRMHFTTKAQLSSHKNNKCHHQNCGKRFHSHKYVLLHQRVHDDERPLMCTWKGCTMTFKWAWARTEHLRLHTGERPYKCKIKGCGLTFRYVSDFSRHRRKTGHVNPQPN